MMTLTGEKELDKLLSSLGKSGIKKVARSAVSKALRILAKGMKNKVPPKYKELKRAIGQRFNKDKGGRNRGNVSAKAGLGVGMTSKRKKKFKRKDRGGRSGLGIQPENAHWFVLGTSSRSKASGASTGIMNALLPNLIKDGYAAAEPAATQAMIQGIKDGVIRELAKAKK